MTTTASPRKRVNFMVDSSLLAEMSSLVPAGERSDFVNEALQEALDWFSRKKAIELIEASKKREKKFHTTEEILNVIHRDRRL